jgi:poly(3-hydroxybutyrate) depolymerase
MRIGARNLQTRATVRTIVFQGDKDDNSANANRVISQSKMTNRKPSASAGRRRLYPHVYTDEFGRDTMEQWVVHGLGHPWSGSSSEGPPPTRVGRLQARWFVSFSNLRGNGADSHRPVDGPKSIP